MKKIFALICLLPVLATADEKADALLERVRAQHVAETVVSDYRINIVRPDWKREIKLHSLEDQTRQRYEARVQSPRKLKGTLFIKADNRLLMYMPKLRRRVTISPSMMLEPWMGSDLTNQDLLQADSIIDDYHHEIVDRRIQDGVQLVTIESTPLPDAAVVWGKLVQTIRTDAVPVRVDYHDRDGNIVRRVDFSGIKTVAERSFPSVWRITPQPDTGQYTELLVEEIEFDLPLPEDAFIHADDLP